MSSLSDVQIIPDSYFQHNIPSLPVREARYQYLLHLRSLGHLDDQTSHMLDQPEFYYYFINNIPSPQLVPNDILLSVALKQDNLDDVIDMSMVNAELNNRLKNNMYIDVIKSNVGISRPILPSTLCFDDTCISPWSELAILHKMASRSNTGDGTCVAA